MKIQIRRQILSEMMRELNSDKHPDLPGYLRGASSLTLLPLLRNSGPLKSSFPSLLTGSGFTTTVST